MKAMISWVQKNDEALRDKLSRMLDTSLVDILRSYGAGRRRLDDPLFAEKPRRLGVYDEDDEDLCHETILSPCSVPGCSFTAASLLEFENHYNASHRYACARCGRRAPSPHLLDLHVQEAHDSFFAVLAARKPSYCCYIEECKEKFMTPEERLDHCVKLHKLPKDFRFDTKPKINRPKAKTKKNKSDSNQPSMDVDSASSSHVRNTFSFTNSKQKAFTKYAGKKFTTDKTNTVSVNMDEIMSDLKENLPN